MSVTYHNSGQKLPLESAGAQTSAGSCLSSVGKMAVFFADLQGSITGSNPAFLDLTGYAAEDLKRCKLVELFAENDSPSRQSWAKSFLAAAREQDFHSQLLLKTKTGESFLVHLSATILRGHTSVPIAIVGVVAPVAGSGKTRPASAAAETAPGITCREIDGVQFILASPVMHRFMGLVERVAGHTETVLITGETGTGKELIARTIHESSSRKSRPWVDINCAALPENLVESELFGYEKGAFSGAESSKPGLFELAHRGTLFLDEIAELQPQTQVKLLRVLDGQPFYRLGGHRKIKVDVRIVAATNQDLQSAVKDGRFRQDLFHRLGQFQLRVPPLRERPEDIVALAEHFLHLKNPKKNFVPQAVSLLLSHSWPGNIRELRNLIARVAMETSDLEIDASKLTSSLTGEPSSLRQTASIPIGDLNSMEEQMIIKALERTGGHRALAAEELGISRRTLSRKLKEYNIQFAAGEKTEGLGFISSEQQKFFRARVQIPVIVRNSAGEEVSVQGVNLSTGGMGLDGFTQVLRFAGLLDVSFVLPDSDAHFEAKARLMWIGDQGRVGIRFTVIEPSLFQKLQHWTNKKMREEGWEFPS